MRFEPTYINREKMYSIGIDTDTDSPMLEVVCGGVAMWTEYYRLTIDEFENYPANRQQIDQLAYACARGERPDRRINIREN